MPLLDYEYGNLADPTVDVWEQWSQGTLADDWSYEAPTASGGYDQYGVPISTDPLTGEPITWGQQFIPESGMSFSDFNAQNELSSDAMLQEGYQSIDWGSYSGTDNLSGMSQDELAQTLGNYGFEYLIGMYPNMSPADQAAFDEAGGVAALGALFAEQYGASLPAWSSTGLDLQQNIYAAQEASMWSAYNDWESSQMGILEEELNQLGLNYLMNDYNTSRGYSHTISNMNIAQADFIRNQISENKNLSRQQGISGLSGGSLSRAQSSAMSSVTDNLKNINLQKDNARRSYQLGQESANAMYEMNANNMVEAFQQSQEGQLNTVDNAIDALVQQFELFAGQQYEGWYADLIDQMADLDVYTPEITVDGDIFEWNPFGVGIGSQDAIGYDTYACAEGQHWDFETSDCVLDAE